MVPQRRHCERSEAGNRGRLATLGSPRRFAPRDDDSVRTQHALRGDEVVEAILDTAGNVKLMDSELASLAIFKRHLAHAFRNGTFWRSGRASPPP
jgi:hypothetical protein